MKPQKITIPCNPSVLKRGLAYGRGACCALLLLLAPGAYAEANVTGSRTPFRQGASPVTPAIGDADITAAIQREYRVRPLIPARSVTVSTAEGIVSLTGTAGNILIRDKAEEIALAVKGVRGVVNRIQVEESGRTDEEISKDLATALLTNPATDSYEVRAEVANGKVTLTGKVDSWAEARLAMEVAKRVKGVREVDSDLAFNYQENRMDAEIAADIRQQLRHDVRVGDALIDLKLKRGAVTLSGLVGSALEKEQAEYHAWVAGVKSVDSDLLLVDPQADPAVFRKDKFVEKPDAAVKKAVEDALRHDPRVNAFRIQVAAEDGKVTLTGAVDNLKAKKAAAADAKNIVGVWRVNNMITTTPESTARDKIKDRADFVLFADPVVAQYGIQTTVSDGKVTLNGTVDNHFEKAYAEDVVSELAGVSAVENNLKVNDTYSYLWVDVDPVTQATIAPKESDAEIKEEIKNQMAWSPFVDAEEVTVEVKDGKATLRGTVDSLNEEKAAVENAYEGGAVAVDSNLEIGK